MLGIRDGCTNKNISECLGFNLRIVQRIRKDFNESNGDYECATARKNDSARSDKKITLEFVGEIKTTIDNDPLKSMGAIAMDTGVSEFLIRQRVHEDIRHFSYKMRKGQ